MNIVLTGPWTLARFLAWEDKQEGRHEFDGRGTREVTGGTRAHQQIVSNLLRLLEDALDPARFDAVAEMRLEVGGRVRYPDVSVVAGRVPGDARTLRDAVVLFEVVSPETAAIDRGEKRIDYAGLPGLSTYVILEQSAAAATVLTRTASGWIEAETDTVIDLPELELTLSLAAVHRRVR